MYTCNKCKNYKETINKLSDENLILQKEVLTLQNTIKLLNDNLEEIKINNYDPIDEYFT